MIDDFTSKGFIRRWVIIDGFARCPYGAVHPGYLSEREREDILAANAAVRKKIAAVEAYEAALRNGGSVTIDEEIMELAARRTGLGPDDSPFKRDVIPPDPLAERLEESPPLVVPEVISAGSSFRRSRPMA